MNRLFIELYLDEDVNVLVAHLVRAHGYAAVTTVEAGRRGDSDDVQLAYAVSQGRAVLTHNRSDFAALAQEYTATGRMHSGIIIAVRRPPHELTRRLLRIFNAVTADEMQDQVRYI